MTFPFGFSHTSGITVPQAHVDIPEGLYEEEHGREGFFGPVSHLYHQHAPTGWTAIDGPLKPRAFDLTKTKATKATDPIGARQRLLFNDDVAIWIAHASTSMTETFRNADGEELLFVHAGSGTCTTDYGDLSFTPGDYLVLPRGVNYRLTLTTPTATFLVVESFTPFRQPDRGILGQHALYDPTAVTLPTLDVDARQAQAARDKATPQDYTLTIKRENTLTRVTYPFDPINAVGWKGTLSPWKLAILDLCPVMSHRAHLAPSVHSTFVAGGFVVCSFVPRPLETRPGAEKVPFYHRNIDYDEVIFYHDGHFFSRDGIHPGMLTLHPMGIHHGPHPGAVKAAKNATETNEVAVMVDARRPLHISAEAFATEWAEYWATWQDKSAIPVGV